MEFWEAVEMAFWSAVETVTVAYLVTIFGDLVFFGGRKIWQPKWHK